MAFRVFLSHSLDSEEVALAWRLQTLAAAHGIEMYVPRREGKVPASLMTALEKADCVMAILTANASPAVQSELMRA
jgi:hypothetical protein